MGRTPLAVSMPVLAVSSCRLASYPDPAIAEENREEKVSSQAFTGPYNPT
jgi:hypothetical protein